MGNAIKRNKDIRNNQIRRFDSRNGRAILLILLFVVGLFGALGMVIYERYTIEADKNNILKMRSSTDVLISRIKASNQKMDWMNESSCAIHRPNSLGESVSYSCNARHVYQQSIVAQQDVDDLISIITKVLKDNKNIVDEVGDNSTNSVKIADMTNQNSYYNATSFTLTGVRMDRGTCYVRYAIQDMKNAIEVIIECAVSAKKPYFEPAKEE